MKPFQINRRIKGTSAEEIREIADQILVDQAKWLEEVMKIHLPKEDHDYIIAEMKKGTPDYDQIRLRLGKHRMHLEQVYEVGGLRLWKNNKPVAQFTAKFDIDGVQRIFPMAPSPDDPDPYGDSIWPGKDDLEKNI